jgi:hypothetical protein
MDMIRRAWLVLALAACGGNSPPPAKLFANGGGECPDVRGCDAPIEPAARFEPPDTAHPPPAEPSVPQIVAAKVPEASCADVGRSIAALELGNYADEDERAPVNARHEARCVQAKLDRAERQCVFEAADQATMAYCAPRLFPAIPIQLVEPGECWAIMQKISDRMKTLPVVRSDQSIKDRRFLAIQQSCQQDRWTLRFGECVRTDPELSRLTLSCSQFAPEPLRKKLADRLAAVK